VQLFVTRKPNSYLTRDPPSTGLVKIVFGCCSASELKTPPGWIGPGLIDASFILGTAAAHGTALAVAAEKYEQIVKKSGAMGVPVDAGNCTADHVFSRVVWGGLVATHVPVTIMTPWESPVVSIESPVADGLWSVVSSGVGGGGDGGGDGGQRGAGDRADSSGGEGASGGLVRNARGEVATAVITGGGDTALFLQPSHG
jgi:hypothetical protein